MYEPYGEKKRFPFDFNELKQRIKEKFKNLKVNSWEVVAILLLVIGVFGSYTGMVTYASKIREFQTENLVLQKQTDTLESELNITQQNLTVCMSDLKVVQNELNLTQTDVSKLKGNLQATQSDLESWKKTANLLNRSLQNTKDDLQQTQIALNDTQSMIDALKGRYDTLKVNFEDLKVNSATLECKSAKALCGRMEYYFVKNSKEIVCCLKQAADFCVELPESIVEYKKIAC